MGMNLHRQRMNTWNGNESERIENEIETSLGTSTNQDNGNESAWNGNQYLIHVHVQLTNIDSPQPFR